MGYYVIQPGLRQGLPTFDPLRGEHYIYDFFGMHGWGSNKNL